MFLLGSTNSNWTVSLKNFFLQRTRCPKRRRVRTGQYLLRMNPKLFETLNHILPRNSEWGNGNEWSLRDSVLLFSAERRKESYHKNSPTMIEVIFIFFWMHFCYYFFFYIIFFFFHRCKRLSHTVCWSIFYLGKRFLYQLL